MAQERRFFVDQICAIGELVTFSAADSHHIANVLRLMINDIVTIVSKNTGAVFTAHITALNENGLATAKIDSNFQQELSSAKHVHSHLLVALPKGDLPEWITEKATELGASSIGFFEGDRSVVKLKSPADILKKQRRLEATAEAAAKQSMRSMIPKIFVSEGLETALHTLPTDTLIIWCSLDSDAREFAQIVPQPDSNYALIIGPEGSFSPSEIALLSKIGAYPLTLGPLTLRVETAAICALAQSALVWQNRHQ